MAASSELAKLLAATKEAKKTAETDLSLYPEKVHASLYIAKTDATKQLTVLSDSYNREIKARAAVILTRGSAESQDAFRSEARRVAGQHAVLAVSALEAYTRMATDVEPTIGREREFAGTQLGHLLRSFEAVGREAGASFLKTPTLKDGVFIVRTFDDLVAGIRNLLLDQVGPALNRDFIQTQIFKQALDIGFKEAVAPVIVTDASPNEVDFFSNNLFNGVGIVVDLPEDIKEIDEKYVVATFDALKAARKNAANQ